MVASPLHGIDRVANRESTGVRYRKSISIIRKSMERLAQASAADSFAVNPGGPDFPGTAGMTSPIMSQMRIVISDRVLEKAMH
jgi:hypothetical protein